MGSNDTVDAGRSVKPTDESIKVLAAARLALERNKDFRYGNAKLEQEFYALELYTPQERFAAVDIALAQVGPTHRCGPNPPGEVAFTYGGHRLYAFKWYSPEFASVMYMKFCLSGSGKTELLVLYSFHEDQPKDVRRE